jgi:hypothetical protein
MMPRGLNAAPLRQNAIVLRLMSNGSLTAALPTTMCGADWFDGP